MIDLFEPTGFGEIKVRNCNKKYFYCNLFVAKEEKRNNRIISFTAARRGMKSLKIMFTSNKCCRNLSFLVAENYYRKMLARRREGEKREVVGKHGYFEINLILHSD